MNILILFIAISGGVTMGQNTKKKDLYLLFQNNERGVYKSTKAPVFSKDGSYRYENNYHYHYAIYAHKDLEFQSYYRDSAKVIPLSDLKNYPVTTIQALEKILKPMKEIPNPKNQPRVEPDGRVYVPPYQGELPHPQRVYFKQFDKMYIVEIDKQTQVATITRVGISTSFE